MVNLTNTPNTVYKDFDTTTGKPFEPIKAQIRLLLNEMLAGIDGSVNTDAGMLPRKLAQSSGNYAVDAADFNVLHFTFGAGLNVTWNLAGISFFTPYQFAAGIDAGTVILDAGPGYFWRNVNPVDGTYNPAQNAIRLRPGHVIKIYRFTTNEFWVIGGYAKPAYRLLNTGGADGFFARGPDGIWFGSWRRTLAAGNTVLTFSSAYGGAPAFTGTFTRFTGFAPIATTAVAALVSQASAGAGTMTLNNAGASIDGLVSFTNLTE